MRRLSHWLMKQPDLEEEALRMFVRGRDLTVQRQTMADSVDEITLTAPSGKTRTLTLTESEPGVFRSTIEANELGLWRATDGKLTALANVGPANPREFTEVTSTTQVMRAVHRRHRRRRDADRRRLRRASTCRASSRCARATPSAATTGSGCACARRAWCAASACCRSSPARSGCCC